MKKVFRAFAKKWKRWVLRGFIGALLFLLLALGTLPWWLGSAIRWLASDIAFEEYETLGYGRFILKDVEVETPQASIKIDRLESYSPLIWLWNAWQEKEGTAFAKVGKIEVRLSQTDIVEEEPDSEMPADLLEVLALLEEPIEMASYWAPRAEVESIVIVQSDDRVEIDDLKWQDRSLSLTARTNRLEDYQWDLNLALDSNEIVATLESETADLQTRLSVKQKDAAALVEAEINYEGDSLNIAGQFGSGSWLPQTATWDSSKWSIAPDEYGVETPYSLYEFALSGEWKEGVYRSKVGGDAYPRESAELNLPPVAFESSVSGDLDQVSVESFSLTAPGLEARTTDSLSLGLENFQFEGELKLDIDFDLATIGIETLSGRLGGAAFIGADENGKPVGRFELEGAEVAYQDQLAETLVIDAGLNWPILSIHKVDMNLNSGSMIRARGEGSLSDQYLDSVLVDVAFSKEFLDVFVPNDISLEDVAATIRASGPIAAIKHSGSVSIGSFEDELLKPMSLALDWSGIGASVDRILIGADNSEISLETDLSVVLAEDGLRSEIERFSIERAEQMLGSLPSPARLELSFGDEIAGEVAGLELKGDRSVLSLGATFAYPSSAEIKIDIQSMDTESWINPWLKQPVPSARVNSMNVNTAWSEGPIESTANLDASLSFEDTELQLIGSTKMVDQEVRFESLTVSDEEGDLVRLSGVLPYELDVGIPGYVKAHPDNALAFDLETTDSPTLIALLDAYSPVGIEYLNAKAKIGGTLGHPEGEMEFSLKTQEGEGEHGAPSAEIKAVAVIDGSSVTIDEIVAKVLEDLFKARLSIEIPEEALLLAQLESPSVDWLSTRIEFSAPDASLAPIAFFVPELLTPGGSMKAELGGSPKDGVNGFIDIRNLNTRAIFPFGSFREIHTRLEFENTIASLSSFEGNIGREPMKMDGEIDFRELEDLAFQFNVSGEDLPILRQAGMLMRSDLDVVASKKRGEEAAITGEVRVKDGLFLMNTSVLAEASGGGRSAASRPPYFSVATEPFNSWNLDIDVVGEQFMRLETPATTGVLSMKMKLQGTLEEPLSIGRVEFDEGTLIFPFASYDLTEGLIELRIEDPYTPMLSLIGETRRFRYDLGIEISGSAYDPVVRFTSSPPLSSEQIILMVMAGQVPDASFNYSASQRASKIGSYFAKGLLSSGGSGGGLSERFSLNSGENLSEQGKETIEMEFLLDERFQLLGEYDEYDAWNTGIRWRILRRKAKEQKENSR